MPVHCHVCVVPRKFWHSAGQLTVAPDVTRPSFGLGAKHQIAHEVGVCCATQERSHIPGNVVPVGAHETAAAVAASRVVEPGVYSGLQSKK